MPLRDLYGRRGRRKSVNMNVVNTRAGHAVGIARPVLKEDARTVRLV